uniref:P-type domain-containing protein n=1 Tax=Ciona intestinalis TaxID=7719 RepID=H2XLH9_CIOIN
KTQRKKTLKWFCVYTCISRQPYTKVNPSYSFRYWTKGCATQSSCLSENSLNSATCRPGTQGSSCTYCCEGANCNVGDITAIADFTCDNVSVTDRIECGWSGITQVDCFLRGCCYLNAGSVYDKWCYHTKYGTLYFKLWSLKSI